MYGPPSRPRAEERLWLRGEPRADVRCGLSRCCDDTGVGSSAVSLGGGSRLALSLSLSVADGLSRWGQQV